MGKLVVLAPYEVAGLTADRGSGVANLLTVDPREVWADAVSGGVATLRIDLNFAEVCSERPREVGGIVVRGVFQPRLQTIWNVAVSGQSTVLDRYSTLLISTNVKPPQFPLDVFFRDFQQMCSNFTSLSPNFS